MVIGAKMNDSQKNAQHEDWVSEIGKYNSELVRISAESVNSL
jgi:hypothetical protein